MRDPMKDVKVHMQKIRTLLTKKGYEDTLIDEFIMNEFIKKDRNEMTLEEIIELWFCAS